MKVDEPLAHQYVMTTVIPNLKKWVDRSLIESIHEAYAAGAEWQKAEDAVWIKEFERRVEHYRSEFMREYDKNVEYVVSSQAKVREQTIKEVFDWMCTERGFSNDHCIEFEDRFLPKREELK